jgi:hypothetical protein
MEVPLGDSAGLSPRESLSVVAGDGSAHARFTETARARASEVASDVFGVRRDSHRRTASPVRAGEAAYAALRALVVRA